MLTINKLGANVCAIAVLSVGSATAYADLSETGEFIDGVAAIVNEGVVLKSQVRDQMALIIERASTANPPMQLPPPNILREQLLERLIMTEIQLQRAARIGIQVSDQMLNAAIGQMAQQNGVAFEDMPILLAQEGIDYSEYRRELREQLTLEQLRQIDVGRNIRTSPREIEQCIADLEGNVIVNSDFNLSHILISLPESATAAQIAEAKAKADDVYEQLKNGADFGEMAVRYSNAQTALEGGSLGWMKGSQLPTLYTDIVAAMKGGDFSEPFRGASSFHIVKINEMRSADQRSEVDQVKVRHILVTPNEIIDDETAKQRLDDAVKRIQDGEEFGEIAKLLSDDPGSANSGGDMGWAGPGTFVPEFEEVVNNSEIGDLSSPFRSRFGWHIIEVLDRRVYDNTEDLKESNCVMGIQNSKLEEETQVWMRRLRDEAFVDTRI
ncbi:MAG: peptidylprolyl isomerase [Gammaproteobacteria bacterium]|nr:peptidylprolyl isomerase [Gammaproteobacteria bacterium]MDH3373006.1 peptidylprolyl isomerase [Gammaproteobacteria bacterium]MDH3408148.1 peptidylprolyl isomerase [Gammaproteobacteria bacterium]MDH3552443.1 peptidylprolyl isomerase [Gammaproteobacteria bacterium]